MYLANVADRSVLFAPLTSPDISYSRLQDLIELIRTIRSSQLKKALLLTHQQERATARSVFGIIADHVNLTGKNPLIGFQKQLSIPLFPDMSQIYPKTLQQELRDVVESHSNIPCSRDNAILVGLRKGQKLLSRERRALSETGNCYITNEGIFEAIIMGAVGIKVAGLIYSGEPQGRLDQLTSYEEVSLAITDIIQNIL